MRYMLSASNSAAAQGVKAGALVYATWKCCEIRCGGVTSGSGISPPVLAAGHASTSRATHGKIQSLLPSAQRIFNAKSTGIAAARFIASVMPGSVRWLGGIVYLPWAMDAISHAAPQ